MDLLDGQTYEMQGSAAKPYILKNVGGVYSCSCPAWRNQSLPLNLRTCKHIIKLRGSDSENDRIRSNASNNVRTSKGSVVSPVIAQAQEIQEAIIAKTKKMSDEKTPPPVLLAESWDFEQNITGWWMSEKCDGVRAYFDKSKGGFISRLGNIYYAPDWYVDLMPDIVLDGELWLGRKKFQETVSIVRRQDKNDLWKNIKYVVFDAPAISSPFENRIGYLQHFFNQQSKDFNFYVKLLNQSECKSIDHVKQQLKSVEELGGEGLMLRQPGSYYVAGRSSTLLKVKSFYDDEATVVAYEAGKGKHKGRMGALLVNNKSVTFKVGTGFKDYDRENPPKLGSVIKYRYQELTDGGVPRFPSYVGLHEGSPK